MYYVIFIGLAVLVVSASMIKTFIFTKEDTENAIKANAILYNVNKIENFNSIEKKLGIQLHSIYELGLPISTYLVKENNLEEITFLNNLQKKVKIYKNKFPLKETNCILLNQENLLTSQEFQKCLSIENKNYNWIENNSKGLKYIVNDTSIAKKLNLTNKDDNNKIITDNNYVFNNFSNTVVRSGEINNLIKIFQEKQKENNYIENLKIINKIKQESPTKATEILENTLNNNNYFNRNTVENEQLLKNVLYIILDNDGNLLINNNFLNIKNFLNINYNYIDDTLNKMTYYISKDKVFNNIKTFLNK